MGDLNDGDEEEEKEPDILETSDNTWAIKGTAQLSEVAEELKLELPTEKYDTMGGYVFSNYGMIPEDGTEFELELESLHVRVTEIRDHRIMRMTVTVTSPAEDEEDEDSREDREKEKKDKKEKSDKSEKTEKSEKSEKKKQ